MYIIIEGMPGTGKTTIARGLSNRLNANYMKSVLSDTKFGNALKIVRNKDKSTDLELMILSDLALDELRVTNYLKYGDLVRDKAITAT
ncbi:MAG: AAA family ATPase, partial [Odoribacter sp.]|nr:AAA family ATPase [Odoribacter sp.]